MLSDASVCKERVFVCVAFYILFIFDHALFCCYFYRYMYRRVDTLDTHSISHTLSGIPHISFIYIYEFIHVLRAVKTILILKRTVLLLLFSGTILVILLSKRFIPFE